jgi:elongation factor G
MKAFYFDGENGEQVREEAIPADMADQAKAARDEMLDVISNFDDQNDGRYFRR